MVMSNKKENEGLKNAVKFCVYPCNVTDKTIDIPEDEMDSGKEELYVRYLISSYGFAIQICQAGSISKKEHFDPPIKDKLDLVKKGLCYRCIKTKSDYEIISDEDEEGDFLVKTTNFHSKDKTMSKEMILSKLKGSGYVLLVANAKTV